MVVFIAVVVALTYVAVVTAAWIVTLWGRALHRTSYEKADAEGMLLLKDPRSMLRALENVLEANNTVRTAGEAYSDLFYCWAGFGFAPDDDPEFARVARLREILGAEGLTMRPAYGLAANGAAPVSPPAPRIERTEGP